MADKLSITSPMDDALLDMGAGGGGSTPSLSVLSPMEGVDQPPAGYKASSGDCIYDGEEGLPKGDAGYIPQVTRESGKPAQQSIASPAEDVAKAP